MTSEQIRPDKDATTGTSEVDASRSADPESDSDETGQSAAASESPRVTPGTLLLAQREALELSLQHVADELNLTMHYVKALESDSYDKLPGEVFVKGYIRSYARLLGLDPEQVLAIHHDFTHHKQARKEEAIKRHARRRMDKNRPWIIFSGVAFVVVALLLWFFGRGTESAAPVAGGPRDAARLTAPADAGNINEMPVFAGSTNENAGADETAPVPFTSADSAPTAGELNAVVAGSVADGGADDQANGISLVWPGDDHLQLSFTTDTRVDIEHEGGDEAHRELHLAGEQLYVQGTAPFSIVLADATGVTLSFNGRQVDLSSNIRADNSVRLNLGL